MHPSDVVIEGSEEDKVGEGYGMGVKWLQQLLVKNLSQSVTSAPLVSAVTGEGVTQTCLFHRLRSLQSVRWKWYKAALACCATNKNLVIIFC